MNICLVKIVGATENFSNMESLKAHEVLNFHLGYGGYYGAII